MPPHSAWREWGGIGEGEALSPEKLHTLGLSQGLVLEGNVLQRDVYASGVNIDWGQDPEPGDYLEPGTDARPPLFHEVPKGLRSRGVWLAERAVSEVQTLWVIDPQRGWHLGVQAPPWSLPLPASMDQYLTFGGYPSHKATGARNR